MWVSITLIFFQWKFIPRARRKNIINTNTGTHSHLVRLKLLIHRRWCCCCRVIIVFSRSGGAGAGKTKFLAPSWEYKAAEKGVITPRAALLTPFPAYGLVTFSSPGDIFLFIKRRLPTTFIAPNSKRTAANVEISPFLRHQAAAGAHQLSFWSSFCLQKQQLYYLAYFAAAARIKKTEHLTEYFFSIPSIGEWSECVSIKIKRVTGHSQRRRRRWNRARTI